MEASRDDLKPAQLAKKGSKGLPSDRDVHVGRQVDQQASASPGQASLLVVRDVRHPVLDTLLEGRVVPNTIAMCSEGSGPLATFAANLAGAAQSPQ